MKLENLQLVLAQRTPWQAMDLGLHVARQHYKALFIISAALTCTLALLLLTLCQNTNAAFLLLFWFKPIIERPLLFYISRAIFDDAPTIKQSLLSLTGAANRSLLKTLFIHRFSASRSFNDPVVLLEELQGEARSKRLQVLHNTDNGSSWLSILGIHIESALQMALFTLPIFLLPSGIMDLDFLELIQSGNSTVTTLMFIAYIFAVALVAPFYVCGGFILYLNQRTHLEAWDIELGFKKISGRMTSLVSSNNPSSLTVLSAMSTLILVSMLSLPPNTSWAEESKEPTKQEIERAEKAEKAAIEAHYLPNDSNDAKQVRATLNDILSSDIFGEHYKEKDYSMDWDLDWDWDWDWDFDADENEEQSDSPWLSLVKDLAMYFKYLIILLLSLLLLYILTKYQPWLYFSKLNIQKDKPKSILGMDMSKKSLPEDFISLIAEHLKNQQFREGLSLMFRAHLINAIHVKKVPFKQSSTEQECLVIMQAHSPQDESKCFAELVMHWQMLAYAHERANSTTINQMFIHWQTFVTTKEHDE